MSLQTDCRGCAELHYQICSGIKAKMLVHYGPALSTMTWPIGPRLCLGVSCKYWEKNVAFVWDWTFLNSNYRCLQPQPVAGHIFCPFYFHFFFVLLYLPVDTRDISTKQTCNALKVWHLSCTATPKISTPLKREGEVMSYLFQTACKLKNS